MMHNRRWCVGSVADAQELASKLTGSTWTLCTGFFIAGHEEYLFLNDATHEDGAGEWGVLKGGMQGPHVQIESITFSWCDEEQALEHIRCVLAGEYDDSCFRREVTVRLDPSSQHRCVLCQ